MNSPVLDLYHLFYTCPDLHGAEAWWSDVMGASLYQSLPYLESERRSASFLRFAGTTIEPASASDIKAGESPSPVQRFAQRFGYRWHSIAWFTSDLPDVYSRLLEYGVRMFQTGGGQFSSDATALFTHPKDTFMGLEFAVGGPDGYGGSRQSLENVDRHNLLGIGRLAGITVLPRDVTAAERLFTDVLGGKSLERRSDAWYGLESTLVAVGDYTVLELGAPTRTSSALGDDAVSRDVVHAVAYEVESISSLRGELIRRGVPIIAENLDQLVIAPAGARDARIRFVRTGLFPPVGGH
jgi:hypothetical protein